MSKPSLVVVEVCCYQAAGQSPISPDSRFLVPVESEEYPCVRPYRVGQEPRKLDYLWFGDASMVVIKNSPPPSDTVPSEEEARRLARRVVEVRFEGDQGCYLIPPGQSFRGCPSDVKNLTLRCREGETSCTVYVFPK